MRSACPIVIGFAHQIDRGDRLDGRNGMLVSELHIAFAFEQHAEQIIRGDAALQHHAVDRGIGIDAVEPGREWSE